MIRMVQRTEPQGFDMRVSAFTALGAALTMMLGSAAQAALINFTFVALDGAPIYTGTSLDESSALNLDGSTLLVSEVSRGDASGLTPKFDTVSLNPVIIDYGSGAGPGTLPGSGVTVSWTGGGDVFTETLTNVELIDRGTSNQIIVRMSGMVNDSLGAFVDAPIFLLLDATQFGGPGTSNSVTFTNTTTLSGIPELSTWAMMALGFGALGYTAARRRKTHRAVLSA